MPIYCYRTDEGELVERRYRMGKAPARIRHKGKWAQRSFRDEWAGRRHVGDIWPLCSDALGVHPSQRQEAYEQSVRLGVPTQFNELGQAVFESRSHRKRYCEALGVKDLDGGYGDAT